MAIGESTALGTELKELRFENAADWWVKWNDPAVMWRSQPTYLLAQGAYLLGAVLTLIHALTSRGRWPYLWFATVFHGLVVEAMSYFLPDVDNFWHSQTPLMFLGRRLPVHIIFLYACFIYQAAAAVSKLRLPRWAEPFAVALTVVLIDIPYDIMCVKFAHWTWHDTDPNIGDRHYWVPWNSYYFHASFTAGFMTWFNMTRASEAEKRWQGAGAGKELLNMVLASLFGTPTGVFLFVILYHPMHDLYKVHSEVIFFALFAVFLTLSWAGSHSVKAILAPAKGERRVTWRSGLLLVHLVAHYALWLWMAAFGHPEQEVSTGLHETLGPCKETVPLQTASGLVLKKRKYLCKTDYDEKYFDFHCLPGGKPPQDGAHWYTICGTPFENRAEYVLVIATITVAAAVIFFTMHCRSAGDAVYRQEKAAKSKLKTK